MSDVTSSKSLPDDAKDASTLSELFDSAFELFDAINKTEESTSSPKVQSDIRRTMNMLEDATRLVSIVDMFAENERFEEVATENMKYFLLPALLGTLATKICGTEDRMHILSVAEIYFTDFLRRLKTYGLIDIDLPKANADREEEEEPAKAPSDIRLLTEMVSKRNTKLQRYREQKELESQLTTLKENLSNPNIDEDIKRDYFVTLIKLYVSLTIDELSSLAMEKQMLEYMKQTGKTDAPSSRPSQRHARAQNKKLQPIIITRDEIQKKVYGAGYPSLPILTVQEFYEQRVKDGDWPDPSQRNQVNSKCLQDMSNSGTVNRDQEDAEDIEKEEKIESDDPEALKQQRAMDEYKDTHRRGWGNRANRS